MKKNWR